MEPKIFLFFWLCFVIFLNVLFYTKGKKVLKIFPPTSSKEFIYSDYFASGYSAKSLITKLGGASKLLHIIVTKNEVWIKSFTILAWIASEYDLLHKIEKSNITDIRVDKTGIKLDFKDSKGNDKQIIIITRDKEAFLKAI